jgi:hypothetical protein
MNKRPLIVGVMGGGSASPQDMETAYELGRLIAQNGWILLNGGRNSGIMESSARGAWEEGGITLGILPDDHAGRASQYIRIPVLTGMGSARNTINVLTSHVVVACPGGTGTLSEIALALKAGRPVILFNFDAAGLLEPLAGPGVLRYAQTPEQVIEMIKKLL